MYDFTNKVIVITGATSGIGAATARLFSQQGGTVVLVGRNDTKGKLLAYDICQLGGNAHFFKCDVTNECALKSLDKYIRTNFEKVDVLFNNAGIMLQSKEIEKTSIEDWRYTFLTNLDSVFVLSKLLKDLILTCKGTIINTASVAGMHCYVTGRSYSYSSSKAALIQFSRQMAKNYAEYGVRVNCICPGIIDTPILGERDRQIYAKRIPLGYVGSPKDVANVVLFLASELASYITGAVIPIDGGVVL